MLIPEIFLVCILLLDELLNVHSMLENQASNAIYSKVVRNTSADIAVALTCSKCLPKLLYGAETCPLLTWDINSLS